MIDLYTAATPNGFKASIVLEELGMLYEVHPIDLRTGQQFSPEFLKISPNNKIPAIVDRDASDVAVFESGAILVYLAEKTGRLLAPSGPARYAALQWLFFQVGGVGPMMGQAHHFRTYATEKIPYAIDRYTNECKRLFHVVDRRLEASPFLAGDEYTIADIANFTWLKGYTQLGAKAEDYPHLARWIAEVGARPAVARGLTVPAPNNQPMDAKAREILFGKHQYERR